MRVTVVGAGFSGLTLAHYLVKHGLEVTIFDKSPRPGGLIGTVTESLGRVETAANALMADRNVEDLFKELELEFAETGMGAKKRFIYWDGPKRWPVSRKTTWLLARRGLQYFFNGPEELLPFESESVRKWGRRVLNAEFTERMIEPALQGIYAGDGERMSATLVLQSMLRRKAPKGRRRGSVAPAKGMGSLIDALHESLESRGVLFQFKTPFQFPEYVTNPIVIATSAWGAAEILRESRPEVARILAQCESLPLVRATCFFEPSEGDLEGFGCLFPVGLGFHSLGVLFDSCIFSGRSEKRAESWILGGAFNQEITAWGEAEVIERILLDRRRLLGSSERPLQFHVTWWQRAIPHYTVEWEKALKSLRLEPPLFLHGNYMGQLGLSGILAQSRRLADQIKESYG